MKRRIHLTNLCDCDSANFDKEFQLKFRDYKKDLEVVLHLPHWWIKVIAENLWYVIHDEEKKLVEIKDSMQLE